MWPQTAYKHELQRNNLAAYLVACRLQGVDVEAAPAPPPEPRPVGVGRLLGGARRLVGLQPAWKPAEDAALAERIVGFVGVWFMVGEAHIVTIAVAPEERRRGIGELLLIAATELALRHEQEVVTLECRVSNLPAQALYEKYGFSQVGVRKRYYTDNNEDALIMTTPPIQAKAYQQHFEQLRASHRARFGVPHIADSVQ